MISNWTFGQKIAAGFTLTVVLALVIGTVGVVALRRVVDAKDRVINTNAQLLVDAHLAAAALDRKVAAHRGYMVDRGDRFLERLQEARGQFMAALSRLKQKAYTDEGQRLLAAIERDETEHQRAEDRVTAMRRDNAPLDAVGRAFDEQVVPVSDRVRASLQAFEDRETRLLNDANQAATATSGAAISTVIAVGAAIVVLAAVMAFLLTRALSKQIGTAVGQVQSSSAELQAAANQQATATKEQATAMNEIATTITELLATAKQIAESAQRVAHIAGQTATSARSGDTTVEKAHESIAAIRRQVDLIVSHMLDLGKKSQQIGAVLDIVAELAEQTNILAINATIEAAGAGEAGKRFAVVADEIRKLADRVAASTKEIRSLIDEVRSSVNTTVMTTETGSKAVDAGARQFADVASAFKQIAGLVATTTEAAREIELSTKQQSTAVEQVNVAITNVAQATRETEASSGQTLQTAGQLGMLSRDLLRLVQPQTPGHAVHRVDEAA